MKKLMSIIISILFALSMTGLCFAQAPAAAPKEEKKMEEKKPAKEEKKKVKKAKKAKKAEKKEEKKEEDEEGRTERNNLLHPYLRIRNHSKGALRNQEPLLFSE